MIGYPTRLQRLLDYLSLVPDRADRIRELIGIADRFREVPSRVARRPFPGENLTPACESEVYVFAEPLPDGTLKFWFAVENPQGIAARALAVILDEALSGEALERVAGFDSGVVYEIFGNELSMGKSMGLMSMVSMVQLSARKRLSAPAAGPQAPGGSPAT